MNVGVMASRGVAVMPSGSVAASEVLGIDLLGNSAITVAPDVCTPCGVSCA
jgi:hypothetical protein